MSKFKSDKCLKQFSQLFQQEFHQLHQVERSKALVILNQKDQSTPLKTKVKLLSQEKEVKSFTR